MALLNVRQTARQLGVHENTVRNWANAGILVGQKLPTGYWRFEETVVAGMVGRMAHPQRQCQYCYRQGTQGFRRGVDGWECVSVTACGRRMDAAARRSR